MERLQKFLAESGVASRRKCEELISAGRVKVNGVTAVIGDSVNPQRDRVSINGKIIKKRRGSTYIMLHKPRGYTVSTEDSLGRHCVTELVKDVGVRLFPAGRLDRDSEGLLLMTDDGDFANRITHPSGQIPKLYRVTIRPDISDEQITEFMSGIVLDGRRTLPAGLKIISKEEGRVVAEVTLREGRNRQIRRMFDALGIEVARLKRVAVGPVRLGMLAPGKWRKLSEAEIGALMNYGREGQRREF